MRPTIDQWAMSLVRETSKRSTCVRRNVACILLNERNHVIGTGYNGVASGQPHCNSEEKIKDFELAPGVYVVSGEIHSSPCIGAFSPSGTNLDGCQAIHAEQNALLQCRDVYSVASAYVSASPCMTCVKLLMNTGCKRIVFDSEYPHTEAKNLWLSNPARS